MYGGIGMSKGKEGLAGIVQVEDKLSSMESRNRKLRKEMDDAQKRLREAVQGMPYTKFSSAKKAER